MSNSVSHLSGLVNKKAFTKYRKSQQNSVFSLQINSQIAAGDSQYASDSSGLVSFPYRFSAVSAPVGHKKFLRRFASSSGAIETQKRGTFLYENLQENTSKNALVNPAKSPGRFLEQINAETGEIISFQPDFKTENLIPEFDPVQYRIDKYSLQSEARELLKDIKRVNGAGREVFNYRVCDCLRNFQSLTDGVSIVSTSGQDRARFKGLQSCGSVWHCPICSSRISEYRSAELRFMLDMWQQSGKGVIFVTNTIRHTFDDDLRLLLDALFGVVWNRYTTHRAYKSLRKSLGYLGRVRSVEVTHGKNGWHPHIHEIWLIEKQPTSAELNQIERKLFKVWNTTLRNAGMGTVSREHGLTVQLGTNAADYVAKFGRLPKWDLNSELTKSHLKRGKQSSTPFDLLKRSLNGDKLAGALFREYAIAFAGRRQLYFSTGLKDFFMLREIHDEEVAAGSHNDLDTLATITNQEWKKVLLRGDRAVLLTIAETSGLPGIVEYLKNLQ